MQIVYHLGAHCTDEERLVRTLLRNRGNLAQLGIAVPAPGRYRATLRDTLIALKGGTPTPEAQEALLDSILDLDDPQRIVFCNDYFLGMPIRAVGENGLYPTLGRRAAALANLFPEAVNEFHIALRNPATMIPALVARAPGGTYAGLMGETSPLVVRWLPAIRRLIQNVPEARIVVWCNEDTPVIWPEVLRSVAGVTPETPMEGEYDLAQSIMAETGFARMTEFLATHPPQSTSARRKILTAFLEKFAKPDALEMDVPMPGWTGDLVDDISAEYERDCDQIRRLERVEMILP